MHGFYGASSMERLPAEAAIRDQSREASRHWPIGGPGSASIGNLNPEEHHDQGTQVSSTRRRWTPSHSTGVRLALTVAPEVNGAQRFSGGVVDLPAGKGHTRHNHPGAEEIIFVISGNGEQMVEDEDGNPVVRKVRAGLHGLRAGKPVPLDAQHRRWPMQLFVVYSPAGPELALRDLPDFRLVPKDGCKLAQAVPPLVPAPAALAEHLMASWR